MEAAAEAMRQRELEEENKKASATPRFLMMSNSKVNEPEEICNVFVVNRGKIYTPGRKDPGTPRRTPARFGI